MKTDSRDAVAIAKCLAHNSCETIWIPSVEDNEIKEYIRMRDDHKTQLKKVKQQIKALFLRENIRYTGGRENWTVRFLDWLSKVELSACIREILDEYLFTYRYLIERIERFDKRIEEFSQREPYRDNVKKLCCFPGIKMLTAMAILCEIGDFKRFAKAEQFMSYLGIVPGENSSGEKQQRLNITKAGNSHIRRLLVESAHSYNRISKTPKSKELKRRQAGAPAEVIEYADKARDRLRRRYFHLVLNNKKTANTANTAIARELAGFIWGMLVGKIK